MAAYILFGALLVQMVELVIKGCDMLRRLMQVRLVVQTINRELGRVRVPSLLIYATLIVTWRTHIRLYMEFYWWGRLQKTNHLICFRLGSELRKNLIVTVTRVQIQEVLRPKLIFLILCYFVQCCIVHMLEVLNGHRLRRPRWWLILWFRLFPICNDIDLFLVGVSIRVEHLDIWLSLGMAKAFTWLPCCCSGHHFSLARLFPSGVFIITNASLWHNTALASNQFSFSFILCHICFLGSYEWILEGHCYGVILPLSVLSVKGSWTIWYFLSAIGNPRRFLSDRLLHSKSLLALSVLVLESLNQWRWTILSLATDRCYLSFSLEGCFRKQWVLAVLHGWIRCQTSDHVWNLTSLTCWSLIYSSGIRRLEKLLGLEDIGCEVIWTAWGQLFPILVRLLYLKHLVGLDAALIFR